MAGLCFAVVLLLAGVVNGANITGHVVFAQWRCTGTVGCDTVELDVSVLAKDSGPREEQHLAMLLPSMPFANATFNILTAFDSAARVFYVAACQTPGSAILFGSILNGSVSNATVATKATFVYPQPSDVLVRIHFVPGNPKGSILALFANGNAVIVNAVTGATTLLVNLFAGQSALTNGAILKPSAVDTLATIGMVYTLATDVNAESIFLISLNVVSAVTTVVPIKFLREHWSVEVLFHAVFLPDQNGFAIFAKALDPQHGFDQIVFVGVNGATQWIIGNMLETGNYGFNVDPNVKEDDTYQTGCYDPSTKKLYFQASVYAADDDRDRTTALVYAYLGDKHPYVDVVVEPMNIGYMGMVYVEDSN